MSPVDNAPRAAVHATDGPLTGGYAALEAPADP